MSVTAKSRYHAFLEQHDQEKWNQTLDGILPSVHPVDRTATRIWFGFWPLELTEALRDPAGAEEMARVMDLEGRWRLEDQIDLSVQFLYGAKYWRQVKKAVLSFAERSEQPDGTPLEQQIQEVARQISGEEKLDESLVLGITAVAFMILQQVGMETFSLAVEKPADGAPHAHSADGVVRRREKKSRDGLFGFVRGVNRSYQVVWDEKNRGSFKARHGEDLASAGSKDQRDYRSMDYRRPDGPIPVECRIASCGYCWVGIVSGKDNVSELSEHEKKMLHYFGYDQLNDPDDPRPPIRLACQAQCQGDVTLVIPDWNGELKRRLDKTRDKLGTA